MRLFAKSEPLPIDREDVNAIFGALFDIHCEILDVLKILEGDDGEEEKDDA